MKVIQSCSIGRLHELAIDYIKNSGYHVTTEDGESTIESDSLCLITNTPFDEYRISKFSAFNKPYMDEYTNNLINGRSSDNDFVYDYHSRLFHYNNFPRLNDFKFGEDQIEYIIKKLAEQPTSRRAQAITWIPYLDNDAKDVPCLQYIQCHIVNNKLDMTVMFRSNDMLLAFGANAYALTTLQQNIANKLGIEIGKYTHISLIPHIYDKRDADQLQRFI